MQRGTSSPPNEDVLVAFLQSLLLEAPAPPLPWGSPAAGAVEGRPRRFAAAAAAPFASVSSGGGAHPWPHHQHPPFAFVLPQLPRLPPLPLIGGIVKGDGVGASAGDCSGGAGDGAAAQPRQQQQAQQQRTSSGGGGNGNDATTSTSSTSTSTSGGGGFVISPVDAAKLAGLLAAQLAVHLVNWQRRLAAQRSDLEERLPAMGPWRRWRRGGGGSDGGDGSGGGGGLGLLRLPGWGWLARLRNGSGGGGDGQGHGGGRGLGAALGGLVGGGPAQPPPGASGAAPPGGWTRGNSPAHRHLARGYEAERALDVRAAIAAYEAAAAAAPCNLEALVRAAKAWSDLTYEPNATPSDQRDANARGLEYAERAVALAPSWAGGRVAACVARGRLALSVPDNRLKVQLAKLAHEDAVASLELDPTNDLAHHLMGRWNYEMSQVNFVVRQLVRLLYGASLPTGSVERAADAFAAAIKLAPSRLAHRVELGRALSKLGRCDEARKELEAALAMDVTDVNDALERAEAQVLLARLPRRGGLAVAPLLLGGGDERDSSSNGSANGANGGA